MGKPQVTLTLAGDSSKLQQAFGEVGVSAKRMADEVGSSSKRVADETTDAYDKAGEAADNVDTKSMGFRDTLTGVQDTMSGTAMIAKGDLFNGFFTLGAGIGDLGSGFYNFLIPAMKAFSIESIKGAVNTARQTAAAVVQKGAMVAGAVATNAMAIAQRALNLAMRLNPIGLVITAITLLVGGFILAYKRSETFRNIVQGAMRGVVTAFHWVTDAGGRIWEFFRTIAPKIGGAFKGLAGVITAPFRMAFDSIRWLWNHTIGGKGFTVPGWVPNIGGKGFTIPYFHTGGVVPGGLGSETLAVLKAGERVSAGRNAAGGGVVIFRAEGQYARQMLQMLKEQVRVEGGLGVVFQ
ncbi:MAG: hypothetical protein HOV78_05130 [Hamadaea sp.]|nr:hypothetical protein [Hamadaea sp.]